VVFENSVEVRVGGCATSVLEIPATATENLITTTPGYHVMCRVSSQNTIADFTTARTMSFAFPSYSFCKSCHSEICFARRCQLLDILTHLCRGSEQPGANMPHTLVGVCSWNLSRSTGQAPHQLSEMKTSSIGRVQVR
jgi:hypothetical protein